MKIMDHIGRIAAAPLNVVAPIERWYIATIPKPIRFVLVPVRWVVCVVACLMFIVWALPFGVISIAYGAWKGFK